ncbi:hypothetical protein HPB50_009378 [Hyalomma asiaticum]|uniref:Uncharacterized protein n=1 Tax=Hyalomma asiaticum TaxID=266040 RepID=A0ACB7SFB2_HYAAI|nr:hypothetical protein HPB50_009378 [Hyalomma asiaticum]
MNEVPCRMQIIKRADLLTSCTPDYLETLRAKHDRLPLKKGAKASEIHRLSNAHNRRRYKRGQWLRHLKCSDGSISTEPAEIEVIFRSHFKQQFERACTSDADSSAERIKELCQGIQWPEEKDFTSVCDDVTVEELCSTIRSMSQNTAPGSDSLTTSFYGTVLDILGEAFVTLINSVFRQHKKPRSFTEGRIVLLLKEGAPQNDPASWRPIPLLNTDYKIISTVINARMKTILPKIISPHQACAVPGRTIFTNLTITRDVFEYA